MRKSDLAEILSALNTEELDRFRLFIQSPYHVKPAYAETYLRCLDCHGRSEQVDEAIDDSVEYHAIYPGEAFVASRLGRLKSELLGVLRQWIAVENLHQKYPGDQSHLLLARFFLDKKLPNHYLRSAKELEKWSQSIRKWQPQHYAHLIDAYEMKVEYATWHESHLVPDTIKALMNATDTHFAFTRFYFFLLLESYHVARGLDFSAERTLMKALFQWPGFAAFSQTPHGQVIMEILSIRLELPHVPDDLENKIKELKDKLTERKADIDPWVYRNLIGVLYNLSYYAQVNLHELRFDLDVLRAEVTLENPELGKLHENEFLNLTNSVMLVGKTDTLRHLLQASAGKIYGESGAEEVRAYAQATVAYLECNYASALHILLTGHFTATDLKLNAKVLEIQVLFDSDHQLLDSRVEAFKVYVFREKEISERNKEASTNFANILKRLIRPGNTFQRKQLERILSDAQACTQLARRAWLEKKIEQAMTKAV